MLGASLKDGKSADSVERFVLHSYKPAPERLTFLQLYDLVHHPLPCPGCGLSIAHHEVSSGDVKVYDRLAVGFVLYIKKPLRLVSILRSKCLLFPGLVVLNPVNGSSEEHAVSLSH